MNGFNIIKLEFLNPLRRQVHIDKYFHEAERGTSISSERQAAYDKAAVKSSCCRYGYIFKTSSAVRPEASKPITVPTVTRNPRMQGFPPITFGLSVIRSKFFIVPIYLYKNKDLIMKDRNWDLKE